MWFEGNPICDIVVDKDITHSTSHSSSNNFGTSHFNEMMASESDVILLSSSQNSAASHHQYGRNNPELQMLKITLYEMAGIGVPESMCRSFIVSAAETHRLSSADLSFLHEKANIIWRSFRAGEEEVFCLPFISHTHCFY